MASEDEVSLLVIVLDVNPIWWGQQTQRQPEFTLSKCLDAVMVMGNSHLIMTRTNKLAIIASTCQESHFLFPSKHWSAGDGTGDDSVSAGGDGKYELLSVANDFMAEEIRALIARMEVKDQTDTLLAGALAKALCYIHRLSKQLAAGQDMTSRILVIKAAEDCALQYMNFMNVIFAAQKQVRCPSHPLCYSLYHCALISPSFVFLLFQGVLIDACVLDSDSGLLQQACDITGGLYLKIPQRVALTQYLLWVFLPDSEERAQLVLPPSVHVDYRAACFCHRNLIEIGYVCSVCLSIFCNFSPICTTCETAFKIPLPLIKAKKKKVKPVT
ncbi:general transcription factor IIH subunit 3 isoform X1 [Alosa alosa]|uniref:general transcription factor IIH subunit 3 isoform X1 n=1 Tax=Alosa alosa TaxID=278164 RepID=UPI00201535CA|nr:general transcription factor IIH subunit 3 isoform X1 [Alosa alosa]